MPRDPRNLRGRLEQMDAIRAALRRGETPTVSLPDEAMRPPSEAVPTPVIRGRESTPDPRPLNIRGRSYNQTFMDEILNGVVLDESLADGQMRGMNTRQATTGTVGVDSSGFAQVNPTIQQMLHNNVAQDRLRQRMEQDMERMERDYRRELERQLMQYAPPAIPNPLLLVSDVELQRRIQQTINEANRNARQSVHRRPGLRQQLEPWNGRDVLSFDTRGHDDIVDSMQIGRGSDPPEAFIDIEPPEEPNAPPT